MRSARVVEPLLHKYRLSRNSLARPRQQHATSPTFGKLTTTSASSLLRDPLPLLPLFTLPLSLSPYLLPLSLVLARMLCSPPLLILEERRRGELAERSSKRRELFSATVFRPRISAGPCHSSIRRLVLARDDAFPRLRYFDCHRAPCEHCIADSIFAWQRQCVFGEIVEFSRVSLIGIVLCKFVRIEVRYLWNFNTLIVVGLKLCT